MKETLRLVALCDILGFTDMVRTHPLSWVHDNYKQLIEHARFELRRNKQMAAGYTVSDTFDYTIFSDSMIIWSADLHIHPNSLDEEIELDKKYLDFMLALKAIVAASTSCNMPLRAGVALGPCIIDKRQKIFIGKPIIDAYHTESVQDWIGIGLHSSVANAPTPELQYCFNYSTNFNFYGVTALHQTHIPLKLKPKPRTVPLDYTIPWPQMIPAPLRPVTKEWLWGNATLPKTPIKIRRKYQHTYDYFLEVEALMDGGLTTGITEWDHMIAPNGPPSYVRPGVVGPIF